MAKTASLSSLTRDDLLLAVQDLVARKRITPSDIQAALKRRRRIARLERELAALRGQGTPRRRRRRGGSKVKGTTTKAVAKPKKRKIRNTPKLRAARKLQGQYMGRLVKLKGKARASVKARAKKESVAAAIRLADKLLRKGK